MSGEERKGEIVSVRHAKNNQSESTPGLSIFHCLIETPLPHIRCEEYLVISGIKTTTVPKRGSGTLPSHATIFTAQLRIDQQEFRGETSLPRSISEHQ